MASNQRGDTLVEVLMAIVIMSVVIVGAITMTSRGLGAAQIALEHTQVRTSINSQIELLQYLRDEYVRNDQSANAAVWRSIVIDNNQTNSTYNETCEVTPGKESGAFYLSRTGVTITKQAFNPSLKPATIAEPGTGMWIEAKKSPNAIQPGYIDFVVRSCWQASGSGGEQRVVTAIRLYDPYGVH